MRKTIETVEPNYAAMAALLRLMNDAWLPKYKRLCDMPTMPCKCAPDICAAMCAAMVDAIPMYVEGTSKPATPGIGDLGDPVMRHDGDEVSLDLYRWFCSPLDITASDLLPPNTLTFSLGHRSLTLAWDGSDWSKPDKQDR